MAVDSLTDYLGNDENFDYPGLLPEHPTFPHKSKPATLEIFPMRECEGCPQAGTNETPGHITYKKGILRGEVPGNKISASFLRNLQYLVSRVNSWLVPLYGSQAGILYNALAGGGKGNFAEAQSYKILSVAGNTLTCEKIDSSDCGLNTYGNSSFIPEDSIYRTFQTNYGMPQPNDEVEFIYPSALLFKSRPSIKQVIYDGDSPNQIQFVCDATVENAMTLGDGAAAGNTDYFIRVWRQFVDPEQWQPVVDNQPLKCWPHSRTIITVSDLDADGIVELKNRDGSSCRIAIPADEDGIIRASWIARGKRIDNSTTESVEIKNRVKIVQDPDGPTWQTFLCLGVKNDDGDAVFADLRSTYSQFSVVYFPEAPAEFAQWKAPCQGRCANDIRDHNNSEFINVDGAGQDDEGNSWFCKNRKTVTYTLVPDMVGGFTSVPSFGKATGVPTYYPGKCYQPKCSHFEILSNHSSGSSFWSWWTHPTEFFRDVTCKANNYLVQLMPAIASHFNIKIGRAPGGHPSLRSLLGRPFTPHTPTGMHNMVILANLDESLIADYQITMDGDDQELVPLKSGHAWDNNQDWSDLVFATPDPKRGLAPNQISYHLDKPFTLDRSLDYTVTDDPFDLFRSYEDYIGGQTITMDTFEVGGRSAGDTPMLVDEEPLVIPRVSLDTLTEQDRNEAIVTVHDPAIVVMGEDIGLTIEFLPIRNIEKEPINSGSGTIKSVEDLGGNLFKIVLDNQPHQYSTIEGESGSRRDEIVTFRAGGNVGCPDYLRINNYYEDPKTIGSGTDPLWIGDGVKIDATVSNDPDFDERSFTVTRVVAHGEESEGWGSHIITQNWTVTGFWEPVGNASIEDVIDYSLIKVQGDHNNSTLSILSEIDVPIATPCVIRSDITGENIKIASYNDGTKTLTVAVGGRGFTGSDAGAQAIPDDTFFYVIPVVDSATFAPYNEIFQDVRPAINPGEFWMDRDTNRIYFNGSDFGNEVNVYWRLSLEPLTEAYGYTQTEYVVGTPNNPPDHVEAESYVDTGIDEGLVGTYDGFTVKDSDGNDVAYTPDSDVVGHLLLIFDRDLTGLNVQVQFDTGEAADSPGDIARIPGYGTWGKNNDYIIVKDDGFLQNALDNGGIVGETIQFWQSGQVYYPGVTLETTPYQLDTYTAIPGSDYICESGNGKIYIKKTWVDDQVDRTVCIKADIRRFDHRALPAKRTIDGVIDQVQLCNRAFISPGGGDGTPLVLALITQTSGYLPSAWSPDCSETNSWRITKGNSPAVGISRDSVKASYSHANFLRKKQILEGNAFVDDYGFFNFSNEDGTENLLIGSENFSGILIGSRWNGTMFTSESEANYYNGSVDPMLPPDLITFYPTTGHTWHTSGFAGTPSCGGGPDVNLYSNDIRHVPPGGLVGNGPLYHGIVQGEGFFQQHPWREFGGLSQHPVNYLGAIPPETIGPGEWGQGPHSSFISVGASPGFGLPYLLKRIPAGSTIIEAKVRIRVSALHHYTYALTGSVDIDGILTTDVDIVDDTSSIGLSLMGGRIIDESLGTYAYTVLAGGPSGTMVPDQWSVCDWTAIAQLMLDDLRDSPYVNFSLVPSPSISATVNLLDTKGILQSFLPSYSYGVYVSPSNTSSWHNPASDFYYQQSWEGSYTTWENVEYDNAWIKFKLPNSEKTRTIQHFGYPMMSNSDPS
jgi:hypothetical protein